jgi:soluble lytic murein transglycosylase-like protein
MSVALGCRLSVASGLPDALIQSHIDVLSPYQRQIEQKLQQFDPLVQEIFKQLDRYDLPESLVLVPMLESSYNPQAVSPAKAAGLWQLMPATAKRFGLKVSYQQDERFEIAPSTSAAIQYLAFLHRKFKGDLTLTLAAYNAGEGRVQRTLKASPNTPFHQLPLPRETQHYVRRFYALDSLVNVSSLRHDNFQPILLFSGQQQWQKKPLIDLTPLPALVSL